MFVLPAALIDLDMPALSGQVATWVAEQLGPRPEYGPVATQAELEQQLDAEAVKRVVNCRDDDACVAKIQQQTQARLLVTGSVGRVGRDLLLTLSVIDTETAVTLNRVGETAPSAPELRAKMPSVVGKLFRYEQGGEQQFALPYEDNLRIGIFSIDATGVDEETVQNLSQLLAVELAKVRGAEIISPDDIEALIGAAKYREVVTGECSDECFARLSGSLNVAYIVVGQVGKLDTAYVISLRLIDQKKILVVNRVTETFRGPEEELKRAIRSMGRRVVGVESEGDGTIAVSGPVSGAQVVVGDEPLGTIPLKSDRPFPAGRLDVRISKDGYLDWQSDVFVQPGETNLVWAELQEAPKSVFEEWWFWTIVGTVVVGGTVAGVALSQRSPDTGSGTVIIESGSSGLGR